MDTWNLPRGIPNVRVRIVCVLWCIRCCYPLFCGLVGGECDGVCDDDELMAGEDGEAWDCRNGCCVLPAGDGTFVTWKGARRIGGMKMPDMFAGERGIAKARGLEILGTKGGGEDWIQMIVKC